MMQNDLKKNHKKKVNFLVLIVDDFQKVLFPYSLQHNHQIKRDVNSSLKLVYCSLEKDFLYNHLIHHLFHSISTFIIMKIENCFITMITFCSKIICMSSFFFKGITSQILPDYLHDVYFIPLSYHYTEFVHSIYHLLNKGTM